MEYRKLIDGMRRFGSTEADICRHMLGVGREAIRENVILAPWWQPASMPELGSARYLSESDFSAIRVWDIEFPSGGCTYIRTGIGAPVLMDVALALGLTACKRLIFIGSVGSLTPEIGIGDVVVPEYSICGDGASRYLADSLAKDCFGTCAGRMRRCLKRSCVRRGMCARRTACAATSGGISASTASSRNTLTSMRFWRWGSTPSKWRPPAAVCRRERGRAALCGAVQRVRQHRLRQVAGQRAHGGRESVPAIRQKGAVPADSAQRA